ncbi:hypothetical protein GQ457_06G012030 [Hibiscus cannabinus]
MHSILYSFKDIYLIYDHDLYYYIFEGSGDQFDRLSAQPSSSHSVPVRAHVVTRMILELGDMFSPDQAGNPLRPKASPWAVPVLALEDRLIPVHLILL